MRGTGESGAVAEASLASRATRAGQRSECMLDRASASQLLLRLAIPVFAVCQKAKKPVSESGSTVAFGLEDDWVA